jgi:hypothetical protein
MIKEQRKQSEKYTSWVMVKNRYFPSRVEIVDKMKKSPRLKKVDLSFVGALDSNLEKII